jgi:hypothetical protein
VVTAHRGEAGGDDPQDNEFDQIYRGWATRS